MNTKLKAWVLLISLSLVWGSSFILMKKGMVAFSSGQVAALRLVLAFVFLLPLLIKYYKIDFKKFIPGIIGMGIFGNFIPAFLFTWAETGMSSSLTGMLNALTPIFTIILAIAFFKGKTNTKQIIGIVIGFVGATLLLSMNDTINSSSENDWKYGSLVIVATLCYAISVNLIRKYLKDLNSVAATVWSFTLIGPFALGYLFSTDFTQVMTTHPAAWESLGFITILGIVGSALSVIAFNALIKLSGPVFASSCTYLIPIVAIFWGVLDGESVNTAQILAIFVILGAIWLITSAKE